MSLFSIYGWGYADKVVEIALKASAIIMQYYENGELDVTHKEDNSPVTAADVAANDYIVEALRRLTSAIPIISEESAGRTLSDQDKRNMFWLVDPLDGTKSFIRRSGEFTVNIALIEFGVPIFGVVTVPTQNIVYYTNADGEAFKRVHKQVPEKIQVRRMPKEGAVVVASKSHRTPETDAYINTLKVQELVSASSSLKFCLVAEGKADVYPRFGPTMEWDTAAGHAIVRAAGGTVELPDGTPLRYGKEEFRNPSFIVKGRA